MRILVIGAAGGTGKEIVSQAVKSGHDVTAFVHDAKEFTAGGSGIRVVEGDAENPADLERAIAGQDAVIDALGGHTPWKETTLEQNAAKNVIDAMQGHGVRRLLVISAIGVGESRELAPGWYEKLIMPTLLRGTMKDKEAMEPVVEASGLQWTIVRPGHLVDGERTGNVKLFEAGAGETAHKITRADVAGFLVEALEGSKYIGETVNIASN